MTWVSMTIGCASQRRSLAGILKTADEKVSHRAIRIAIFPSWKFDMISSHNRGFLLRLPRDGHTWKWNIKDWRQNTRLAKSKAHKSFVEDCIINNEGWRSYTLSMCVRWGLILINFYVDISWHADSIVQLNFEETSSKPLFTLREYPLAQIGLSEPSKGPSKIRSFFSFKFSKRAETCEPINVNVDAANFVSIGEMNSAVASAPEECWWNSNVGRPSKSFSTP